MNLSENQRSQSNSKKQIMLNHSEDKSNLIFWEIRLDQVEPLLVLVLCSLLAMLNAHIVIWY